MGKGYLIDSNALTDAQTKKMPEKGLVFMAQVMEEFIALANVIEINKNIIDVTIALRKSHRIKLPDAIIAATAIVNDRQLVTRNISDFSNIKGLKVVNPWNI